MTNRLLVAAISTLIATGVYASDGYNVKITRVHMYEKPAPSGGVFINISGSPREDDPCPGSDQQYFIDLNDQLRGALLYSHAMAAFKDDISVNIRGTGLCGGHANVETISDFQLFR